MKFLKNNLKVIIAFLIGILLSGGIAYAAISASQVIYKDGKSVEDALNELYGKSNMDDFSNLTLKYNLSKDATNRKSSETVSFVTEKDHVYYIFGYYATTGYSTSDLRPSLLFANSSRMSFSPNVTIDAELKGLIKIKTNYTGETSVNYTTGAENNDTFKGRLYFYVYE